MLLQARFRAAIVFFLFSLSACLASAQEGLYEKMMKLAQENNPEAQYHIGMFLNNGIDVTKNPKQAFEWFQKSARHGDMLAAYKVGCYLAGQFGDIAPLDPVLALDYKLKAAKAGYSLAQHDVALAYLKRKDYTNAVQWTLAAAAQGEPMALYNLAVSFKEGEGVAKDKTLTYSYFKLAKLLSEGKISPKAQVALDELKASMSAKEFEAAEQFVAQWKSEPSALTLQAKAGLQRAKGLALELGRTSLDWKRWKVTHRAYTIG
jgi:hypothetical protein